MAEIGVALLGAGWISDCYARALARVEGTRLVGVASRTRAGAERLARAHGAPRAVGFEDLEALIGWREVHVVCVNSPNFLHALHALAAVRAGKPALIEKPLCLSLGEADALQAAARAAGVGLGYAENLCFAPLYRRARAIVASGELGRVRRARQVERHGGPYADWFWRRHEAGGGALLDMGCHGIGALRWLLGSPRVHAVRAELATAMHGARSDLEDEARVVLELDDGVELVAESSWTLRGGSESRLEVAGERGSLELDLLGSSLRVQPSGARWTHAAGDALEALGYVGELAHFPAALAAGAAPELDAADGRAVLELVLAAYAAAGGGGPVRLPFDPGACERPVDLWHGPARARIAGRGSDASRR
jgi:predicted dehydrogenase